MVNRSQRCTATELMILETGKGPTNLSDTVWSSTCSRRCCLESQTCHTWYWGAGGTLVPQVGAGMMPFSRQDDNGGKSWYLQMRWKGKRPVDITGRDPCAYLTHKWDDQVSHFVLDCKTVTTKTEKQNISGWSWWRAVILTQFFVILSFSVYLGREYNVKLIANIMYFVLFWIMHNFVSYISLKVWIFWNNVASCRFQDFLRCGKTNKYSWMESHSFYQGWRLHNV